MQNFANVCNFLEIQILQNLGEIVGFLHFFLNFRFFLNFFGQILKIQLAHFVDLEKCCKMSIWLQKSVLIQPRTGLGKSDVSWHDESQSSWSSCVTLFKARSRLYQHRFLRPNTHFAAFFKIYKIIRLDFWKFLKILKKIGKILQNPTNSGNFCKIYKNLQNFAEILQNLWK